MKYKVKVLTEEGKYTLREIKGLTEGMVVEGRLRGNAVEIKWQGEDAVLWLNENCVPCSTRKHLAKGFILDVTCWAIDFDGRCLEALGTKAEVLETMRERGYDRHDYDIQWVVRDYNVERDFHGNTEGIGETRKEAISDFWFNYNK